MCCIALQCAGVFCSAVHCCSVLQCAALRYCSVLQCAALVVAVHYSVLHYVAAVHYSVLHCTTLCCGMLGCSQHVVAVRCCSVAHCNNVLQVHYSALQCITMPHRTPPQSTRYFPKRPHTTFLTPPSQKQRTLKSSSSLTSVSSVLMRAS